LNSACLSPQAFAAIREMYGVDSASYMKSVCGDFNFIQFIANSRSGQFFFYSHDGKYMIKTQTKEENKFLRRILPHYFRHMAHHPDSMVRAQQQEFFFGGGGVIRSSRSPR
jgi:1-phosphatidylinositol-4-phosphate 5-kinase